MYHLYFGNESGAPGTVITFFPWAKQLKGRIGTGQVGVTSLIIPNNSIKFWENRLKKFGVEFIPLVRFGEKYLKFQDPDGLEIELVERNEGPINNWSIGEIQSELGQRLMLPSWLESKREELEETLPPVEVRVLEGDK